MTVQDVALEGKMKPMAEQPQERLKIRDEVAALKRERTVSAAADLFYEKGYDNTTLDEVAERLGVTKPFIYANFGSKSELLAEICERGVRAALDEIEGVLSEDLGPTDSLRLFGRRYVTSILMNQKNIAIYTREEKNLEPSDARRLGEMRRLFFAQVASLLQAGSDAGEFDLEDAKMGALAIGGAVSWSTFWYKPDGRLEVAGIASEMTRLILGIAGAKRTPIKRKPVEVAAS
jgi:TetR/AcrR family transcriptional regulator, cholesterol catabolism regulator